MVDYRFLATPCARLFCLLALCSLAFSSCNPSAKSELPQPAASLTAAQAQAWYEATLAATTPPSSLAARVPTTVRPVIQWDQAVQASHGATWLVLAPLADSATFQASSGYQSWRYLVTAEAANQPVEGFIIEVLAKGPVQNATQRRETLLRLYEQYRRPHASAQLGFEGYLFFYSPRYVYQGGIAFTQGGASMQPARLYRADTTGPATAARAAAAADPTGGAQPQDGACIDYYSLPGGQGHYLGSNCPRPVPVEGPHQPYDPYDPYGHPPGGSRPVYPGGGGGDGGGESGPTTTSVGKFRISLYNQMMFPRFTTLVKNMPSFVRSNPTILAALMKWSHLTQAQIESHLAFDQGPLIVFKEVYWGDAYYDGKTDSNVINIDPTYATKFENGISIGGDKGLSLLLAITILHEYVHYGDYTTNTLYSGEEGTEFEKYIFNTTIGYENAGSFIIKLESTNGL